LPKKLALFDLIAEGKFEAYDFKAEKENLILLLGKVATVALKTVEILAQIKKEVAQQNP
jgi:hypothetical protein